MPRRWLLILGAVLAAGIAAAVVVSVLGGNKAPAQKPTPKLSPTGGPGLTVTAQQLVALLDSARNRTFDAKYLIVDSQSGEGEGTLELWRHPPMIRQDTVITAAGRAAHVALFQLPTGDLACNQSGESWRCVSVPGGTSSADSLISAVTEQLAGRSVVEHDETVGGRKVHCFDIAGGSAVPSQICATAEGIPVRISTQQSRIDLSELSTTVSDDVFNPPAPVSSPSPSPHA